MPRILFVCVENANRSQMAEGFARFHGGYQVEALSAGSRPGGQVSPRAIAVMDELGIDISGQSSKGLDEISGSFDAVVTMGCGDVCPWIPAKRREDWKLRDPAVLKDEAFLALRDDIRHRVRTLLDTLRSQGSGTGSG
jgi:protein-tyrosine-phosphatase